MLYNEYKNEVITAGQGVITVSFMVLLLSRMGFSALTLTTVRILGGEDF